MTDRQAKAAYVWQQPQDRQYGCHWPTCDRQVPPAMWGCREHWFKLPKALRDRIWDAYEHGQEVRMDASDEYLTVAYEVEEWIAHQQDAS
jgi:hypothetical protein